ncbi:MAG TPA: hypothetical protein VMO26_23710 [Vicinamibacterales bacterium]|nr:hypothetical protein [Vicinamibacterales bacterium]
MTWAILAGVVLVAIALVAWLSRSSETPLWHDAARSETLRTLLAARGLDAQVAANAPAGWPGPALPLGWGIRTRAGAQAVNGGTRWLFYDSETRGRDVAGCNSVRSSSGDSVTARHTVVRLQTDSLAVPQFTVMPNVRGLIGEQLPARFREAGMADSKLARAAARLSDKLATIGEHGQALPFPASPDFEAAFRVTGDDANAVRALFDPPTIQLLMAHRWTIIEGRETCLTVSRNVGRAFSAPEDSQHSEDGFLAAESAGELLAFTQALAERLQSR